MATEVVAKDDKNEKEISSVEELFDGTLILPWHKQITFRALVVSLVLGVFFSFIVMKLNLTVGVIPSLNVSAGLLGFFLLKVWTTLLGKVGLLKQPFTRQENTVIQTCVVACYGISFSGGFGSYLLGMTKNIAKQVEGEGDYAANNVTEPHLGWMIGFMFTIGFAGLFSILALRKIMIMKYRLVYPSGTATAVLINTLHTPTGAELAKKQIKYLFNTFGGSFAWGFFQWFFTGGENCGFINFPTFGLEAYNQKVYFDFSATYIGVGMICPYIVNISLLLGAAVSWGILWPIIETKKGDWYSADLPGSSLHGLQGYKVFMAIAFMLGDGLYHFVVAMLKMAIDIKNKSSGKRDQVLPVAAGQLPEEKATRYDDEQRDETFIKGQVPNWLAAVGYCGLAVVSMIVTPIIFPVLRWYHILVIYIFAPVFAFCNAYGCGLTDWSLASNYGKICIFAFGSWVGMAHGGIMAALSACGVMFNIVSTSSDLMQDLKTGYLTRSSPRSMFLSQGIGTAMGCIIGPCVFWVFYRAFPLGDPDSEYPVIFAVVYRSIALLGVEGLSALPKNCIQLCGGFFLLAILMCLTRDLLKWRKMKLYKAVPSPMAMAIPFYLGSYFVLDMCLGSLILFIWQKVNRNHADKFYTSVASGMICGDGIWTMPSSIIALFKVQPPLCMKFLTRSDNQKVDKFLANITKTS